MTYKLACTNEGVGTRWMVQCTCTGQNQDCPPAQVLLTTARIRGDTGGM